MRKTVFDKKFPQNFIIRRPVYGSLLAAMLCFVFLITYKPTFTHQTSGLSYIMTMALYSLVVGLALYVVVRLLRQFNYFFNHEDWSIGKEFLFILIALATLGTAVYLAAFMIEPPTNRWDIATYWDSVKKTILVGLVPFGVFTLVNIRHVVRNNTDDLPTGSHFTHSYNNQNHDETEVTIISQLKKEKLSFIPSNFLYAEAEGNYTSFYIYDGGKIQKRLIRNTISHIEKQLEQFPQLLRTHRAFIVNISLVRSFKGNAAGYKLQLIGTTTEIPVSRQNATLFRERFDK